MSAMLTPAVMAPIYSGLNSIERFLNVAGYIPYIGMVGALGRAVLATAQTVSGIAIGIFAIFFVGGPLTGSFYGSVAVTMLVHGFLNGIRTRVEITPFIATLILLPFDLICGRMFLYPLFAV